VVKGFVIRQLHEAKVVEKRRQDALIDTLLNYIDVGLRFVWFPVPVHNTLSFLSGLV
jgi:hypothetical protein